MNYSNCDLRLSGIRSRKTCSQPEPSQRSQSAPKAAPSAFQRLPRRHRMPKGLVVAAAALAAAVTFSLDSFAATASWSSPTGDRWMYGNAADLGTRTASPLFGSVGGTSDEKLGTLLTIFNTSSLITPGLGAPNYLVSSVTLTLTVSGNTGGARYDGTYDSYRALLPPSDSNYQADADEGRPVELYGAGFRNGYTAATFQENSPYGPTGGGDKGTRNVFPIFYNSNGTATDASNNVSAGMETAPFAIGQTTLTPGTAIPDDTQFTFTLDLGSPLVLAYVQNALQNGLLDFVFTSLEAASQPGVAGTNAYLSFYNKENIVDGAPASLSINYTIAPEPTAMLWLLALGGIHGARRRRSSSLS